MARMPRPSARWRIQQRQPSELAIPSAFNSAFHLQTDEMLFCQHIILAIAVFVLGDRATRSHVLIASHKPRAT
jgi:hypothetical protein